MLSPKTVQVPAGMEAVFGAAEEIVSRYFREARFEPERGTIEISGERYVLVRAASLSVEFFSLVQELYGAGRERDAEDFSRNILFDLAHAIGRSDARNFHAKMGLSDPIARLSAGPVHFAHAGWAFVNILPESNPAPGPDYFLVYDHPYSFESDAWIRSGGKREAPACIMNAGYSSGWCEESFGVTLVASEILCRAKGDECCRFVMAHPTRIEEFVARYASGNLPARALRYQIPDFFARKRTEEQLQQRVEERTRELEASNERLRREIAERAEIEERLRQAHKLEAIGRLAGGVAHDFNNLMSVVIGRSVLLIDSLPADSPLRLELEQIRRAGESAATLTSQLLAFGRSQVLRPEALDPVAVVREVARMLQPVLGDDVELELSLPDGVGAVRGDRGQLEQVLVNLLVNARDAMPGGGRVRVSLRAEKTVGVPDLADGAYVVLEVEDGGHGMDEATRARIFEPFFSTKGGAGGTGLGLATAYGIVKQSGGSIRAESAPERGTRFVVHLPRTDEEPVPVPPAAPIAASEAALFPGTTILLVDDRNDVRKAIREFLLSYGCTVLSAGGAEEALTLSGAQDGKIDVLLTDVVMPRGSGTDLADALRLKRPDIQVIFMSGYAPSAAMRERLGALGASFLQKPFPPDELAAALQAVLDR